MLTMKFLLPLTLVLATCWASNPIVDDVPPQDIEEVLDEYRLPTNVIPTAYEIKLAPIFETTTGNENFTFTGTSTIILDIKNTNSITFHAKGLTFDEKKTTLTYEITENGTVKNEVINPKGHFFNTRKDFVTVTFEENLEQDNVKLFLVYHGKLNEELRGFYKTSYEKEGKKIWLAATHFEPVSARQAFPCWDEPHLKAEFTITIKTSQLNNDNYTAISNMLNNDKVESPKGETTFKKTPKMSPYLVAFVVSDFTALPKEKEEKFRVWANPTVEEDAKKYAFNYGSQVLEEMKNFTKIDYYEKPIEKMDQIAIPNFNAAMENWGLVTYSESGLLYKVNKTTTESKQAIATVIAHEFSHQWFGNLITCKWWDSIWLNEGFATFFQYYISEKVVPKVENDAESWRLMEQFVIKNVQATSFVADASSKTHALVPKNIQTPTQIRSLFDDISYKKGASILHMMRGFLSEDVFQNGIRKYLELSKMKSVESSDFLNSFQTPENKLEDYLPKDVKLEEVMKNWVYEPGYPVVTVTWNETSLDIKQERFFLIKPPKVNKMEWYVPINYVIEESPNNIMPEDKKSRWLIPGTSKSLEKMNNSQWILFNKDQTGYYRVNYDKSNWDLLTTYLRNTENYLNISAINRAQLIDDALNLARTGHLDYNTALNLAMYLIEEDDYIPWYAAVRAFNYLDELLLQSAEYTAYHKYVANNMKKFWPPIAIFEQPENGTHVEKLARVLALNTACKYGLKECQEFVTKKLGEWLEKKIDLAPDLRRGIVCSGLRNAEANTWNDTLQRYKDSGNEDERADILAGLGCASKPEIVQNFLDSTLEKDSAEIFAVMNSIYAGNPGSFDTLLAFIQGNIENIQKADKEDSSLLISIFNKLSNRILTKEQYVEYSLFVHGKLQMAEKVQGFAIASQNIDWIKENQKTIEDWLKKCDVCQKTDSASAITLTSFMLIISLLLTRFFD